MDRKEIVNSQDYKAEGVALDWYKSLNAESVGEIHITDAYADGVIYGWNNPQWIPVEEELPKRINKESRFSETVLVINKAGFQDITYYDYEKNEWIWTPMVTHWKPLPQPPKED